MVVKRKAAKAAAKKKVAAKKTPAKAGAKKPAANKPATRKSAKKSAEMKTGPTAADVQEFIAKVPNAQRRSDAAQALALMRKWTGLEPRMWGPSIIGFGSYHYKYESGREGDMCMTGFSPRAAALVFYVIGGVPKDDPLFAKLGRHKLGGSCLYVNRLADIDTQALEKIVRQSVAYMKKTYRTTA